MKRPLQNEYDGVNISVREIIKFYDVIRCHFTARSFSRTCFQNGGLTIDRSIFDEAGREEIAPIAICEIQDKMTKAVLTSLRNHIRPCYAIRFAQFLCSVSKDNQIMTSSIVRNLYKENDWSLAVRQSDIRWLTNVEENFLEGLVATLDSHWHDPEFDVPDFCRMMSISKPQLYRKSTSITGMSPNNLLREYRLLQSLTLLRNEDRNISQTTFDTGFSSPSYFTKCFQKRFGLQPLAYLKTRA